MKTTNNTSRRLDATLPRPTAAQVRKLRRLSCYHLTTVELADGVRVCTHCEAVLKAVA